LKRVAWVFASGQMAPASAAPQTAKTEIRHVPAEYTDPTSGKRMYMACCASCHGVDGENNKKKKETKVE